MGAKNKMYACLLLARERSEPIALDGIGTPLLRRYELSSSKFKTHIESLTVTVFQMENELPGLIRRFLAGQIL